MGEIIGVVSGKGGVGKTTITACLGSALSNVGHRVLLCDGDFGLRDLDLVLGVANEIIYDALDASEDKDYMDDAIVSIDENLDFLPASQSARWEDIGRKKYKKLVRRLSETYDYILIDAPAGTGRGFRLAAANADMALLVAAAETVSIRSCHAAADRLFEMEIPEIYLILNKFDCWETKHGANLDIDAVIDGAGVQLRGIVPFSADASQLSMYGRAIPKRSKMFAAVERIMKRLEGEDLPLKRLEKI